MSDDKLKALLSEAKSKGASEEQLVGIAQAFFSSKKKDSTELPSTGEVETTPSPSTIQPPGFIGIGGSPLREYEKPTMTQEERQEMWTDLGYEEKDFKWLEAAGRAAGRKESIISEQLGIDVDAPDRVEEYNSRLKKSQRAISQFEEASESGFKLSGALGPVTELTPEQIESERQETINTVAGLLDVSPEGLDINSLKQHVDKNKEMTEGIMYQRTLDQAVLKELTEGSTMGDRAARGYDFLKTTDFTFTRTATTDAVLDIANRAAIFALDIAGDDVQAERFQQQILERNLRSNLELGIDPSDQRGITETWKDGEKGMAVIKGVKGAAQSFLPIVASIANPTAGVAFAGTSGTLGVYEQYRDRGDLSYEEKLFLAGASGTAEAVITSIGMGNVRRFRAAAGIADNISDATVGARKKAYEKALGYLKPYTEQVSKAMSAPATRAGVTILKDAAGEGFEEFSVELSQQILAHAMAGEDFDGFALSDAAILGSAIGGPMAGVSARAEFKNYKGIYDLPMNSKLEEFETLKAQHADLSSALSDKSLGKTERKIIKDELIKVKKEMTEIQLESARAFDKMSDEDKQSIIQLNKDIKRSQNTIKTTDSEAVKLASRKRLEAALKEKSRIEEGLPAVEPVAEPELVTPRKRPAVTTQVDEEITETIIEGVKEVIPRGDITLDEVQAERVRKVATSLKNVAPGITFELHSSRDTYNQTYDNAAQSKGHYNPETNKVHILVDKDSPLALDGWLLLKHEAIHPVLEPLLQADENFANKLDSSIKSLMNKYAPNSAEQKRVLDHAARYKKDEQSLELLTEFLAVFSEPEAIVKFQKEPGFLDRVKQILNSILQRLGIKAELPTNEQEVLDMLNTVSDAFQSGRSIKLDTPSEVRENKIRESVERIQDGKNPYEGALRPEVGEDIESVLDLFRGTNSNFVIAENFDHSLELRRMGFVEKVQLKDGSIVLSAPTVYEKPEIDGIFSVHSKSFVKEEDIQDKKQKAVAKTLNALAGKMDLPIAFVNRPDLNFNAALTYPDSRNDLKETTMVVNLHYANARTGASPFSFAIVDAVRKQNPKVIGDFIKSLEGIQNVMNVSSDVAATYLSYKEAAKEWRDLDESEVQFYALSMSIQETIDRVINKAVHVSFQDGAINFLQNIQEQFAEVLNEEIMEQTDGKGVFKKIGLTNDFVDLLDAVFVSKTVKANYVLSKDQEVITKNVLEKLKEYLSISKRDFAKIRRVSQDAIDLESRKGISLLNVLQDVFDDKTLELKDLEEKGEITKEESEAMMVEYLEDLVKVFNQIISKDRYEKFLNLDKVEDSQIVKDIKEFVASYVKNVDFINNNYQEIYSEFTDFAAQGFPEDFSSERKDVLDVVKKYYDTFPKSQADYLVNTFAGKIDATAFEADIYGKELVLGAYNLDLRSIAEIVNMPYEQMKQSVVQGESGFNLLMSGIDPKTIYQLEVEDIIQETVLKKEAVMEVTTKKLLAAKTVGEVIDSFERKGFKEDVIRIINESDLEKKIPFQHTNKEGEETTEYINILLTYQTNTRTGGPSLEVNFDNTLSGEEYADNKINESALSTATLSEVFAYTKDVAEVLGVSSITFLPVKIDENVLKNPQEYASNLVYKARGRDTRWYRRSLYNALGIKGGLIAKPSKKIAFYDSKIDEDNYYITESSIVLGEASSYPLESFNRIAVGDKSLLEEAIEKSFEADFETNLREDLKSKASRTEIVPINKENPMWEINLENAIRSINENSSIFVDAEEMMNVDLMSTRLESNRIRIAPTAIRESLIGLEEEGREAADAVDGMFQSSEEMIKEQGKKKFSLRKLFGMEGREAYIDPKAKLRKAVEEGFGDYMRSLIRNQAGATAYADRDFVRLKKEIFGKLSSTEEVLLDKFIFLMRVIQIDTNWDNRLRDSKRRLAVIESELEMLKEQKPTKELSDLIESKESIKNMIQRDIDKYSVRPKHPTSGNIVMNRENAEAALAHYKRTIGDEVYDKLKTREKKYFDAYRMILDESYKAGIINRETRDRFITQNYSPRMFLSKMFGDTDDIMWEGTNLSKDQIQSIKDGSDTEIFTDAQYMLSLSIRSLRNKQAKNEFLSSLGKELGDKNLSWIKQANYKKDSEGNIIEDSFGGRILENPSEGFNHVMYREDGALRAFQVSNEYYDVISGKDSRRLFNPATRRLLAKATGTKLVKLFATGIKPVFALVASVRYFQEVTRGRGVYDAYYVLPYMQLVAITDFFKGTGAAVLDSEIVEEYFKYGGGMSFMTLQGKPDQLYKRRNSRMTRLMGKYSPVKGAINVLAYAGEKAELGARIAIYQRTLKNLQKSRPELTEDQMKSLAVEEARMIADFSQGGYITKDLDALKPYLNASIQGTVGTVDYIRRNPKMFTNKLIQSMLVNTAITYLLKSLIGDDEYEKISPYEKIRYNHIPLYKNKDGKWVTKRIPKAHQFMFVDIHATLAGEYFYSITHEDAKEFDLKMLEKDPAYGYYLGSDGEAYLEALISSLPAGDFIPTSLKLSDFVGEVFSNVPVIGAYDVYENNFNRFKQQKVSYDYDRVHPYMEGFKDGKTRDVYRFISDASFKYLPPAKTISAPRLQAAAEKLITNESNAVVGLAYNILDYIITTSDESADISPEKRFKKFDYDLGLKRSFLYTIPDRKYDFSQDKIMDAIDKNERGEMKEIKTNLRILLSKGNYEFGQPVPQDIMKYIKSLEPLDQKFASAYTVNALKGYEVDPIFIEVKYSANGTAAANKLKLRYGFNSWDDLPKDMKREISAGLEKAGYKMNLEFKAALK